MKNNLLIYLLAWSMWLIPNAMLVMPVAVLHSGCSTTSKLRTVETIAAVQAGVHNAMSGYRDAVALGQVSVEDRIEVRSRYEDWERVENHVITGLKIGTDLNLEASPEELSEAAFQLTLLITTLLN